MLCLLEYRQFLKCASPASNVPFLCCYLSQLKSAFGSKDFPTDVLRSKAAIQYVRSALVGVSGVDYGDDIDRYLTRWRAVGQGFSRLPYQPVQQDNRSRWAGAGNVRGP